MAQTWAVSPFSADATNQYKAEEQVVNTTVDRLFGPRTTTEPEPLGAEADTNLRSDVAMLLEFRDGVLTKITRRAG